MPPNFKTARAAGHVGKSSSSATTEDAAPATRNAAYVENLFPDKFGKSNNADQDDDSFVASANASRDATAGNNNSNNALNNKIKAMAKKAAAAAGAALGGVDPSSSSSSAAPSRAMLERKKRRAQSKHLSWDRQVVRKIDPVDVIKPSEKPNYWFSDSSSVISASEVCSLPIGGYVVIQPEHATVIHLLAWEKDDTGPTTGRVTMNIGQMRYGQGPPGPGDLFAVGSLRPFENSVRLNVQLPPAVYVLEVKCNKPMPAKLMASEQPRVLLMLETQAEEHGLK